MPTLLIVGLATYYIWQVIPARYTTVLVADFVDPTGTDSALATQILIEQMREELEAHEGIRVKRLNQPIPAESGSETAMSIGQRPQHKAAVVVWRNYMLDPDPEIHVHFDIVQSGETQLGSGFYMPYGPTQILQPTMFDFKFDLGEHLAQMAAFTTWTAPAEYQSAQRSHTVF